MQFRGISTDEHRFLVEILKGCGIFRKTAVARCKGAELYGYYHSTTFKCKQSWADLYDKTKHVGQVALNQDKIKIFIYSLKGCQEAHFDLNHPDSIRKIQNKVRSMFGYEKRFV